MYVSTANVCKHMGVLQLLGLDVSYNSLTGTLPRAWGALIQVSMPPHVQVLT